MTVAAAIEHVHDYPRPPRLERTGALVAIVLGGTTVAETRAAWRVLETTHPPTYYLPPDAFVAGALLPGTVRRSFCEWKGLAAYRTLRGGGAVEAVDAGWTYPEPTADFAPIRDHVAVFAHRTDGCFVDGERVVPQPGGFYGGWITANLRGPFKGDPGTEWW